MQIREAFTISVESLPLNFFATCSRLFTFCRDNGNKRKNHTKKYTNKYNNIYMIIYIILIITIFHHV